MLAGALQKCADTKDQFKELKAEVRTLTQQLKDQNPMMNSAHSSDNLAQMQETIVELQRQMKEI